MRKEFYLKELRQLLCFYQESNRHGLRVPNIHSFNLQGMANIYDVSLVLEDYDWTWLSDPVIELTSLAQHYKLSTRMLDWTRDPFVALYFACNETKKGCNAGKGENTENLAIWCIAARYLEDLRYGSDVISDDRVNNVLSSYEKHDHAEKRKLIERLRDDRLPLRFWIPRYADNKNVYAQQGILSIWKYNLANIESHKKTSNIHEIPQCDSIPSDVMKLRELIGKNIDCFLEQDISLDATALDELLLEHFNRSSKERKKIKEYPKHILYKFVIDKELRNDLNSHLSKMGYDLARIYPGYESIVEMLKDS